MISFDVFDTLITRTTAIPSGVFALMQDELRKNSMYFDVPEYIRENFVDLRLNSEVLARKSYCNGALEDITLHQIYDALAMTGTLEEDIRIKLCVLEREIEYKCSIGIEQNIDKIKGYIKQGEKVVLISDMYLEEDTIRKMLIKADPIFEKIKIYVSSGYGKTKGSTNLFWAVKNIEKAEFSEWTHYGDNPKTDIQSAERLGIKAQYLKFEPLLKCELKALKYNEKNTFIQQTIGIARNTRLFYGLTAVKAIGSTIGGAVLFPYVWWIIQESIKKKISRLYFIARDGFILKKIADIIIKELGYQINTYYIYGSRRAWRMPSFNKSNSDVELLLNWSHPNNIKTIIDLADVFQITESQLISFLPNHYKKIKCFTAANFKIIKENLAANNEFKEFLYKIHENKRMEVIKYLQQEIDFSDDNMAFVELAGSGYTQLCLANIISEFYHYPIKTFYFKMDRVHKNVNCRFFDFLPSNLYLHVIIEMLCRAPQSQTIGYKEIKNKMVPILGEEEGRAIIQHGIYDYIEGIEWFTQEYVKLIQSTDIKPYKLELLLKYMDYIAKEPDKEVMEFIGGMPNSVTGRENKVIQYAPALLRRDIINIFLKRTYESIETYYTGSALDYSVLRSNDRNKKLIEFCKKNHDTFIGKFSRIKKILVEGRYQQGLQYQIPLDMIGKRIILYAAGNIGQSYYQQLKRYNKCKIVLWVDKKYEQFREMGLPVSNPEEIAKYKFDNIIIAVADKKTADSIREELMSKGIDAEKIF
ncbi:MAG TPA: hypothetical protein GXX75_09415 [Clostridiales bacterium]|nr:hypothetical protein [Clostridiales bacterium]